MIKFTTDRYTIYLPQIYGFSIRDNIDNYQLYIWGADKDSAWSLGQFTSREICEKIVENISHAILWGIVDIDRIVEKVLKESLE